MVRRTKEEAEQTRNAILDAAEQVFFKKGVSYTSIQDIAESAGVTRGAVYWHFRDKVAILDAMGQRIYLPQEELLDRLVSRDSKTPLHDLRDVCVKSMRSMVCDAQRRRVFSILTYKCEYIEEMQAIVNRRITCKDRVNALFVHLFEKARKLKVLAAGWTPQTAAATLQWVIVGFLASETERSPDTVRDREGEESVCALFHAFGCEG